MIQNDPLLITRFLLMLIFYSALAYSVAVISHGLYLAYRIALDNDGVKDYSPFKKSLLADLFGL